MVSRFAEIFIAVVCFVSFSDSTFPYYSNSVHINRSAGYIEAGEHGQDLDSVMPPRAWATDPMYGRQYQGDQSLCPARTSCTVLSECRLLLDLMERSCLIASRLKEVTCGYLKNEIMVCCPNGGNSSPFRPTGGEGGDDDHSGNNRPGQLNQACGKPQLNGWQNGYRGLGSHPWAVRIGFKNSDSGAIEYPCCGSLITATAVLTAAHCAVAKSRERSIYSVRIGEYDMRSDPDCTTSFCAHRMQNILVSKIIVHPGYEKSTFRHDVAIVVLKTAANLSLGAQPICLMQTPSSPIVGLRGTLVGFGKLPDQEEVSPQQHLLDLPIVSRDVCSRLYDRVIPITSNHLCVGGEPKKDACSGFGGAPLVILDPQRRDKYIQVGIVSFGSDKCGAAGVPSVYTSIQEYFSWIKQNMPNY